MSSHFVSAQFLVYSLSKIVRQHCFLFYIDLYMYKYLILRIEGTVTAFFVLLEKKNSENLQSKHYFKNSNKENNKTTKNT